MDLLEEPGQGGNAPEFTVSEISGAVRRVIEGEFGMVRVRGEVGRVVVARTGHMYFDLKDDRNVLAAVSWKGQVARLTHRPEEGMEVIAVGRLTTFGPQSKYQINVEDVIPAGAGALMAMLEKRKAKLAAEGLFDAARKRPLPYLPEVIGVVTSPTGAVIRDILHRLRDRFPRKVLVWPVAVQGAGCAPQVAAAIEGFNRLTPGGALPRPDLIIVARGGGSIEDLWGFNEEIVARAAAASDIPLISAVGHETDTTLIDYAADRRAPTPTAAAELAVPVRAELLAMLGNHEARLVRGAAQALSTRGQRLRDLARALPRPEALLQSARQRLDAVDARLPFALRAATGRKRLRLTEASGALKPALLRRQLVQDQRRLGDWSGRLVPGLVRNLANRRRDLGAVPRLRPRLVAEGLSRKAERLGDLVRRFTERSRSDLSTRADRLTALARLHETLGYRATLARGYAVMRGDGAVISTVAAMRAARALEVEFADGRVALGGRPGRKPRDEEPPEQGDLF
ncbi:MAG: exodeoxyribonuclease VII large subunit [Limimaricola sp.]|uniref:exodeoxyribonuclease VII large subunit n=1 Tax=Limimaricola sp. TaxID=2211665 RepID=UPI001E1AB403|nr:exodeoxyribonuclease VII large subunit [Limimaricola sp.]MBI1416157.1 exodeoxyribonuclease VII large subunit [Limimaricola sp.]